VDRQLVTRQATRHQADERCPGPGADDLAVGKSLTMKALFSLRKASSSTGIPVAPPVPDIRGASAKSMSRHIVQKRELRSGLQK